jgi:hypothetical protein
MSIYRDEIYTEPSDVNVHTLRNLGPLTAMAGITVTLIGPDNVQSVVTIIGNATVRDVVTTKYDLFGRLVKKNGTYVVPFITP